MPVDIYVVDLNSLIFESELDRVNIRDLKNDLVSHFPNLLKLT